MKKTKKKRQPSYCTANQLAKAGNIPIETIRWWIKTKQLRTRKLGRARLILRSDALKAIKNRKQTR